MAEKSGVFLGYNGVRNYCSESELLLGLVGVKSVLNWAKCLFAEHTSDSSTNYDSFVN